MHVYQKRVTFLCNSYVTVKFVRKKETVFSLFLVGVDFLLLTLVWACVMSCVSRKVNNDEIVKYAIILFTRGLY